MDETNSKNKQWKKTSTQLKQAFEAWDELNRREPELSANEKQLQGVKELLKDLKGQLDALSESAAPQPQSRPSPQSSNPPPSQDKSKDRNLKK